MVTKVTVYDTAVDGLFRPGGDAWHWLALVGTEHLNLAIAFAPSRSGVLKASHYPVAIMTPYRTVGGRQGSRYTVRNDAPYAAYVHEGTLDKAPIVGDVKEVNGEVGTWMSVPVMRGVGGRRFWTQSVAGQKANPWIERAAEVALAPFRS